MWGNLVKVTRYVSGKCWIKTQIFLTPKSSALITKGGQILQWNHPLLLVCHFLLMLGKANLFLVIWLDGFSKVTRRKIPLARVNRDQETPKLHSFQEIKSTLSNVVKYFCLIQSFLGISDKKAFWRTKKVADHSQKLLGYCCYLPFQGIPIYTEHLKDLTTQSHPNPGMVTTHVSNGQLRMKRHKYLFIKMPIIFFCLF